MLTALKTQKEEAAKPVKAPSKKAAIKVKKTIAPKKKTVRKKAIKEVVAPAPAVQSIAPAQEEKK